MKSQKVTNLSALAWSVAEILRGDFKQSEYGKVVLPFVILRRLDCLLAGSKQRVLEQLEKMPKNVDEEIRDTLLFEAAGEKMKVYNVSRFTFETLRSQEASQIHTNLMDYVTKFSTNIRDMFLEKFLFPEQLKRLKDADILWPVFERFCQIDLHPDRISNEDMGYLFEELIRRFSEISNETAGEHFTPREVIRLIVDLLVVHDAKALAGKGAIRSVYDPACGTGGMLVLTEEALKGFNPDVRVELYGQELNPESYAICKSDMLVTGHNPEYIAFDNSLSKDAHKGRTFHYMLSNPPYGVDWKKYKDPIVEEHEKLGMRGRFGAGLPRVSDGQLLFLQHMISKMRDDERGSRIGLVMNGSPLFTGGAGQGESEIRRWILENDWLEALIALPTDLFYNTGIQTYVWMLTNRKSKERQGKVQLIDASSERFYQSMRKNLGDKRKEIPDHAREEIVRIYHDMLNGGSAYSEYSKIFNTEEFGYREIRIERPLKQNFLASPERLDRLKVDKSFIKFVRVEGINEEAFHKAMATLPDEPVKNKDVFEKLLVTALKKANIKASNAWKNTLLTALAERDESADIVVDSQGKSLPDKELCDYEQVPLTESWQAYFEREVKPFASEAWVDTSYTDDQDHKVGRVGYEINFNRYFYKYAAPRPLKDINQELALIESEILELLKVS